MIELGIHFGLPAAEYHSDPGLGSGSQKEIALDATEFQWNRLHEEDVETEALLWGRGIHCRTLEGREAFIKQFVRGPTQDEYPGVLVLMADLRAHCKALDIKAGKTKAETIARIREWDTTIPIWDEIEAKFEAETAASGRTLLPATVMTQIETAAIWMQQDKNLTQDMRDGTFVTGASEVSIFYEDNGVRLKGRLDKLLEHAIVDLKSFRPGPGWQNIYPFVNKILGRCIAQLRYDLQAASYMRAWDHARELYESGCVFGASDAEQNLLKKAMAAEKLKWIWVLVKNAGAPQCFVREFDHNAFAFSGAIATIEAAIDKYRANVLKFGIDKDWIPDNPADMLSDADLPSYLGL